MHRSLAQFNTFVIFAIYYFVNSKHLKSRHSKPLTKNEKPERHERDRPEAKVTEISQDLPAVQCKDTLILDYDHKAQYSRRKIESNADRYKELPDVDDDDDSDENGQLSAADFQQLLSQPVSTGDHFTFAAEKSWTQSADADASDDGSMVSNLFKLNTSNLNDGLARVPFYLRHDLPTGLFTEEELTDIHYRSNFFENDKIQQNQPLPTTEQSLLDCLKPNVGQQVAGKKVITSKEVKLDSPKNVSVKSSAESELVERMQQTKIQELSKNASATAQSSEPAFTSAARTSTTNKPAQTKPASNSSSKTNVTKTDDIQDWLDDFLNE